MQVNNPAYTVTRLLMRTPIPDPTAGADAAHAEECEPGNTMPSVSPKQAKLMRAVAHGFKPDRGGPSVAVAKEFMHADERKNAHKTREGRADHKREMDEWAQGKRKM